MRENAKLFGKYKNIQNFWGMDSVHFGIEINNCLKIFGTQKILRPKNFFRSKKI